MGGKIWSIEKSEMLDLPLRIIPKKAKLSYVYRKDLFALKVDMDDFSPGHM